MKREYVEFKSNTPNYYKEQNGRKRNIVRKIDKRDKRFKFKPQWIKIIHKQLPKEYFCRKIQDITDYQGFRIFSW